MTLPKYKILHIIKSLGRGGAEMLLQETLQQHDRSKFEFHYAYFLPWKDQMVPGLEKAGGMVTNFKATDNIRIVLQVNKIIDYIRKNHIDLVHCHLPWAGFAGRLIHYRTGIKVIYTEHNKQERYHWITRTLNKKTFNQQTLAISVSNDVAESIEKNIHPKIKVKTILNGVNIRHFTRDDITGKNLRQQYSIPENAIVIGTIAVFRFQKRLKEWIDLFKSIHEKDPNVYGIIVGDGILNGEIRNYLKESGIEKYILMPGLQTEVLPWLSSMDIFMMTSSFEGLPIALLEAMSMECAVICTDAGGIKEVIRDNIDGLLYPVDEWRDMEKGLNRLIENKEEIKEWGRKARERVVNNFSIRVMVEETENLYLSLLN